MTKGKYDIDTAGIVGKFLPFYTRGRRISLLLQAISHPISQLHKAWCKWAWEREIEAHITSQSLSLAWYLDHKLRARFENKEDSFVVYNGLDKPTNIIFCESEYLDSDAFSSKLYSNSEDGAYSLTMVLRSPQESMGENIFLTIIPPNIIETSTYDNTSYRHEIEKLVARYNTSFKEYQILV